MNESAPTPEPPASQADLTRTTPQTTPPTNSADDLPTPPTAAPANPADDLPTPRTAAPASPADDLPTPPTAAPTHPADDLPTEIAQLCARLRCRPVLIRRHGRTPAGTPRRWFLVDSRPGRESIRTGELPTDEHLLAVLSGADRGTLTTDPIYLVCTHGRHDACCAVRGRPAAAALTAAYPDRTWECSHIGGDRFAANLVFLPHSQFYGHVPADQAVALAQSYNEGTITPTYYRGSGAHPPPVQAAQHFARTAGQGLSVNALHPKSITQPAPNHWSVTLSTSDSSRSITVEVRADMITVDGQMTCAAQPPGQVRQFTLVAPISTQPAGP